MRLQRGRDACRVAFKHTKRFADAPQAGGNPCDAIARLRPDAAIAVRPAILGPAGVRGADIIRPMSDAPTNDDMLPVDLPADADAALDVASTLRDAGHAALLAGGCVRDLLLRLTPKDYDVATDAPPTRVQQLFRNTRAVGVAFGVILVRRQKRWVEVATFRTDGDYADGRRPQSVEFSDVQHDALRRDFTINGMYLEPVSRRILDYVGGRRDLAARLIRCIGEPKTRFAEDHLRLVRAVRFAARLGFTIEPATLDAIRQEAPHLARVASERVRDELERMLNHPSRATALRLLLETGLSRRLWSTAPPASDDELRGAIAATESLTHAAPFEAVLAMLLRERGDADVARVTRALACSNEQRDAIRWIVAHQQDLDDPAAVALSALKRLMAHPAFEQLRLIVATRHAASPDGAKRTAALDARVAAIDPAAIQPHPFITGDDLLSRGVPQGPAYKRILDELYTLQLDERIGTRDQALAALEQRLQSRPT